MTPLAPTPLTTESCLESQCGSDQPRSPSVSGPRAQGRGYPCCPWSSSWRHSSLPHPHPTPSDNQPLVLLCCAFLPPCPPLLPPEALTARLGSAGRLLTVQKGGLRAEGLVGDGTHSHCPGLRALGVHPGPWPPGSGDEGALRGGHRGPGERGPGRSWERDKRRCHSACHSDLGEAVLSLRFSRVLFVIRG